MPSDDRVIAISATFTAEAIQPALAFWTGELALPHEIRFTPYAQLFQELLSPASLFARNRGFNVALIRLDDWLAAGVEESAHRFIDAVKSYTAAAPLILALCPPAPGNEAVCNPAARLIREAVAALPAIYFADPKAVANPHDPYASELGHLPYTPLFFVSLATAIARKIHALSHSPFKVIALDCDDTLWRGICGEDGPQGVTLDPPRLALQQFMAARRREGVLLALCSKNNEEDVLETFRAHPEMPLRLEDFTANRINWESKGSNLASLAAGLELGLDSFILVDDNPKECTEAQTEAPAILSLALPSNAEEIPELLNNIWAFDRARVTAEDLQRHQQYAQRAQRAQAAQSASSLEEFLEALQLDVRIEPMTPEQIPRVAQLTTRTNQMNMSSVRRTEAEIRALDAEVVTVHVTDRFGDYGLTGVVIFRTASGTLTVDTFLLSCRVLGRGVEHRVVAHLGEIARRRGLHRVEIPFVRSQRNRPAELFLESIGGGSLSAAAAAAVRYQPGQGSRHVPQEDVPAPATPRPNYVKIATELRTPESVLARIHSAPRHVQPSHPPRTDLERSLAELWAALLNVSAVGLYDNFFDLGGHSLLAVQLLSRVREIHQVDLSLELVYSGNFTVHALAWAIEREQVGHASACPQEIKTRQAPARRKETAPRVLLAATASYAPPRGGATRSNLLWLRNLAAQCRIVCGPSGEGADLAAGPDIEIFPVADPAARIRLLTDQIRTWNPDHVLVSSEDLSHSLLRAAHQNAPGRVIYLAHTPQFFPFGPESWNPDPAAAALVRQCAGIVAIGHHMAGYIRGELGRDPTVIHPPTYGQGPFPLYENIDRGRIVMINPCAVKGIGIFLEAAARMPRWEFAAVPGWGTTTEDRRALERLPNVRVLPNAASIDEILAETRILIMPSLWYEGFGLIVMEAMLRGIPVVSSDSGGLKEAKAGTGYVIPVQTIERYQPAFDQHAMPKPVLPDIDVDPWVAALVELLTDRDAYQREAATSRQAAQNFVQSLDPRIFGTWLAGLPPRLKILLAQNAAYYPAHGGGEKSNRLLMEALAARGHECRVVARQGAKSLESFDRNGVHVRVAPDNRLRADFAAEAAAFQPDVILASTDDPAHILLDPALESGARVVYLVRATLPVPFGPDSAFPSEAQTARIRRVDTVVGVSQYVTDYVRKYAGIDAVHAPISLIEQEDWPDLGRFDNEFVTMVNPCAVKGIAIFLALADEFPDVKFTAVPTWGTDEADRAALAARANIAVLDPMDDINLLLARTRVLLVPSLWAEARSRMVLEAMLRGVPVVAANTGGLPEAKMGVPYTLPVNPIAHYQPRLNQRMVPIADVPEQDIAPWRDALSHLLTDRDHYQSIAHQSRTAALNYAKNLSVQPFEEILGTPASPWFPDIKTTTSPHLFWFPHAGAGQSAKPPLANICPIVYPGREARLTEPPFERMQPLIEALAEAIEPYLNQPFAFFGHSMGAIVAFELARELRRRGLPLPFLLIASAARAPQFRRNHVPQPEPSDEILLCQAELPDNPSIRHAILPALRADTTLYRHYSYTEDAPLPFPIRAYGGTQDPSIKPEHLEAWSQQTTSQFALRHFPGGHFYLCTAEPEFLTALDEDMHENHRS